MKDGDVRGRKRERMREDCGGMQRESGECSVAWRTVLCAPFPSSRHHSEHEHFFNHSTESRAEPSGGRVSHRSVCSHHEPPPPPRDAAMPHSSMSPALHISPPFLTLLILISLQPFFFFLTFVLFHNLFALPCLHHSFCLSVSLCHLFFFSTSLRLPPTLSPFSLLALDG